MPSLQQNPLPIPSPQHSLIPIPSLPQELLSVPPPSIVLHNLSIHHPTDGLPIHPPDYQQHTDSDLDPITTDDHSAYEYTDSSIYGHTSLSVQDYTNYSGSDVSAHLPPSSGVPSEVSSAVTSDSDLPPPPHKPAKPVRQTGLLNFYSVIPGGEAHAAWGKRKRDNQEKDEKERAEITLQEGRWKQKKLLDTREHNRLSQQKHRKKIWEQEVKTGVRDEDGKKLQVS